MIAIFFDFLCLGVLACSGDCFGNVCFSGLATLLWLSVVLIMKQSRWCCRGKFILDVRIGVPADAVSPNMKAADTLNCWWLDWTGSGQGFWWLAQLELDCPLFVSDCWKLGCSLVLLHNWTLFRVSDNSPWSMRSWAGTLGQSLNASDVPMAESR